MHLTINDYLACCMILIQRLHGCNKGERDAVQNLA